MEIIEKGIVLLNKEEVEDAFKEFKAAENLFTNYPKELDDNYLAVLKYNIACCY
jgi:hypothetical protein